MSELKIEAGKSYESRDGEKAFVGYEREDGLFVGHRVKSDVLVMWKPDGQRVRKASDIENWLPSFSLISEWKEPRKGEVWLVFWFEDDLSTPLFSVQYDEVDVADCVEDVCRSSKDKRIGGVLGPIPWTEGQGLTDGEGSS